MKKAELETAYVELQKEFSAYRAKTEQEKKDAEKLRQSELSQKIGDVHKQYYNNWKSANGKFMKQFLVELIKSGELNFQFEESYGGYFSMNVYMGKNQIASTDGHICTARNGLEE